MPKKRNPVAELPYGVSVARTKNGAGETFWRVRLGTKFTGGKPQKKDFPSLEVAKEWIQKQADQKKETGNSTYQLTARQLAEAADAFKRLDGSSLTDAVSFFLNHARPAGGIRTFKEVTAEFLQTRKAMGVRPRTLTQYVSYLKILNEEFAAEPVSQITRSDLEDFFTESEWSPRTRLNYMVTLSTLFTFAQHRDYCPSNPAAKISRPILEDRPPGILSVKNSLALLAAAKRHEPVMIPAVAIGLFGGLRRSEICVLDWSEIRLQAGTIEVKGSKAKTRQRRVLRICGALKKWLKPYAKKEGPVTVSKRDDVFGDHLRDLVIKAGITDYPHNAIRHSFGSYHYERHRNELLTASEMGNSPAVIFKHYRNLVTPVDAKAYFSITPRNLAQRLKKLSGTKRKGSGRRRAASPDGIGANGKHGASSAPIGPAPLAGHERGFVARTEPSISGLQGNSVDDTLAAGTALANDLQPGVSPVVAGAP